MIQLFNSNFYFYFSFNINNNNNTSNSFFLNVSFQSDQKQDFIELKLDLPCKQSLDEIICRLGNNNNKTSSSGSSGGGEDITATTSSLLFHSLITFNHLNRQLFKQHLAKFLSEQNQLFYDQLSRQAVNNLDKNKIKSYWFKVFTNNQRSSFSSSSLTAAAAAGTASSDSSSQPIQAKDHHKLMHSNVMPAILEKEKEYAMRLNKLMASGAEWPSLDRIERLKREQKSKFQHFIKKLHQATQETTNGSSISSSSSLSLDSLLNSLSSELTTDELDLDDLDFIRVDTSQQQKQQQQFIVKTNPIKHLSNLNSFARLEESYTIQVC